MKAFRYQIEIQEQGEGGYKAKMRMRALNELKSCKKKMHWDFIIMYEHGHQVWGDSEETIEEYKMRMWF